MDKLEVGMYAFSNFSREKGIGRIIEINESRPHLEVSIKTKHGLLKTRREYVQVSHNPIDLIEKDDVLNVKYEGKEYICKVVNVLGSKGVQISSNLIVSLGCVEIESIVTKEQFDSMKYEIGEK